MCQHSAPFQKQYSWITDVDSNSTCLLIPYLKPSKVESLWTLAICTISSCFLLWQTHLSFYAINSIEIHEGKGFLMIL